jgi:hypothetical protein
VDDCELLVPKLRTISIKWLRHSDGILHGRRFFDENPACRGALMAQAKQVALLGRVGKVPENGRQLKGKYADITELKPSNFRFFGFRDGDTFFITNGARKDPKRQDRDYDFAVEIRAKYFERKLQAARLASPKDKS